MKKINCAPGMAIKSRKSARKHGKRQQPFPHEHVAMAARANNPGVTDQPQSGSAMQGPGVD